MNPNQKPQAVIETLNKSQSQRVLRKVIGPEVRFARVNTAGLEGIKVLDGRGNVLAQVFDGTPDSRPFLAMRAALLGEGLEVTSCQGGRIEFKSTPARQARRAA